MSETEASGKDTAGRWLFRVLSGIVALPIVVAAVRDGRAGWQPTLDAGITAVRIRDVFSLHPPLVGLAAQTSFGSAAQYSYPGALEFYLLAVPVRLLGVTWGLLLGMAAINVAVLLAALWFVRRRTGERSAILACVFAASLLWTLGSEALIDPTPVAVGIVPLFALLVAVWSIADGDTLALVLVTFVANYLVLGHPMYIVVVPLLCAAGIAVWLWRSVRLRRRDTAEWRSRWRRDRWIVLGCGLFTVLAWVPPLIDQFRPGGGNLGKVIHAALSGQAHALQTGALRPTIHGALGMVTSVTAVPRWWLPPSFGRPPFDRMGGGTPFVVGMLCAVVLFGLLAVVSKRAWSRGDRCLPAAAGTGLVAWLLFVVTAIQNPDAYGFRARYFSGLWPLSAFLWMVLTIGLVREVAGARLAPWSRRAVGAVAVVGVFIAVLALPRVDNSEVETAPLIPVAASIRQTVATKMAGSGPVLVDVDLATSRLWPAVSLGLQDAGVPFRVSGPIMVQQFGADRNEDVRHDAVRMLVLRGSSLAPPAGGRRIGAFRSHVRLLAPTAFARDTRRMRAWATSITDLHVNPDLIASTGMSNILNNGFATLMGDGAVGATLIDNPSFLELLATAQPFVDQPIVTVPGMDAAELAAWVTDRSAMLGTTVLYDAPVPR